MKKNLTEIVFILDESGSMHDLRSDTIGGFNSLIEKQKEEEGTALVSAVMFSDKSRVVYDRVPLDKITKMTGDQYRPNGSTALFDAVGSAVRHIGNIHKYAREEDVPEHTIFVITTDGMENSSRFYSSEKVKKLISHQKEKYGWEFIFLGANIDAAETAATIGISSDTAVECMSDNEGCAMQYQTMGNALSMMRRGVKLAECAEWRAGIDLDVRMRKMRR